MALTSVIRGVVSAASVGVSADATATSIGVNGIVVFKVDTSRLTAGDTVKMSVFVSSSASSKVQEWALNFSQPQGSPEKVAGPFIVAGSAGFVITQVSGSATSFPWQVITL